MKKYLLLILLTVSTISCEEYLDQREVSDAITEEEVFGSYYNMRRFLEEGYHKLYLVDATEIFSSSKNHTHVSQFGDEGSTNRDRIPEFKSGNWMEYFNINYDAFGVASGPGKVEFTAPYILGFQGIRIANRTIKEIDTPIDITKEQQDQLLGQAYFIRAYCYFEILKRWGGMPYFTEPLDQNDYLGFERLGFQETATKIADDCDLAFQHLPVEWDVDNTGRPVKSVALALKSRVLLYAASKTYNPENDLTKWKEAAEAADVLIKFIENEDPYHHLVDASGAINARVESENDLDYIVPEIESIMPYRQIFLYVNRSPETLFTVYRELVRASGGSTWNRYTTNYTYYNGGPGYLHSQTALTSVSPNENFVEKFETKNGLAIEDDPDYNLQNPYIKRDPRFYNTIVYNGMNWPIGSTDNIVEMYEVGQDGSQGAERTVVTAPYPHTGYMMKKYWAKGATTSVADGGPREVELNIPYFRVAEAYLNYAEAAFEASGRGNINATVSGDGAAAAYTSLEALNKIRNRVGMPNLNAIYQNTTDYMDRVRNERAIEFCFEGGHRWFDILRWHMLDEITSTYGVHIEWNADIATYPTGYKFEKYEIDVLKKSFTERNYFYPINPKEVYQYPEFEQNPNW
ncbi:MAG: RagB/SusD family nutrient uptake outer membrane protein [Bacteroidales bacterium]|nr:RagB/SusD family nutrient uptake outer membrane protein [Bacteroidales bacterium]MCF8389154.1 RagB/SusD family nutrient uptake outer membrane protein [Bacteroidales bacterium]